MKRERESERGRPELQRERGERQKQNPLFNLKLPE
jgi:hypothetical protein